MKVTFERGVPCPMRDGTLLMANLFRPDGDDAYPVVVTRLPYGKDTPFQYLVLDPVELAESGYIVAVQDVRGRFNSQGAYGSFSQELNDGLDTIAWASALPGSNGVVGMYGASYFGFTQMAAAAAGHPALKALAPTVVFDDPFDGMAYRGGALEWGLSAYWYMTAMVPPAFVRDTPRDASFPARFGAMVHDVDHITDEGYWTLPVTDFTPPKRAGLWDFVIHDMTHPEDMKSRWSLRSRYAGASASAAFTGGWYDIFLKQTIDIYQQFRAAGRTARLTIGPWTHGNTSNEVGDLNFGMAANNALLDMKETPTARHQRWFDSQLKGMDNGVADDPPIKYFTMGENRWHTASQWPLKDTVYTAVYFHSQGYANSKTGDGRLSVELPQAEPGDRYVYDPAHPVITLGGNVLMPAAYRSGPVNQDEVESRADVLIYTSESLTEPLEITGPITAQLWVQTNARDTDFVVRLTDVHPDGRSFNVADGIVRMRWRHGMDSNPEFLTEGEIYRSVVDLWATSYVFLAGHRVRAQVTSSSFPRWNRNLNTGASNEETAAFVTAQQTVLHDAEHPSHLILPVIHR